MFLLSVLRPSLEYCSEVWEGNKSQVASLENVMLGGAKRVLGMMFIQNFERSHLGRYGAGVYAR